jgi:hypothetical protein
MASIPFGIEFDRIAPLSRLSPLPQNTTQPGAGERSISFLNDFGPGASVDSSGSTATLRPAGIGAKVPFSGTRAKDP